VHRITLAQPTKPIAGVGLFSAQDAAVSILPGEPATGIVFTLNGTSIPAHIDALSSRPAHPIFAQMKPRCSSVGAGSQVIATVEHVMSALTGMGITDAIIDVHAGSDHAEIPIADGSSKPFTDAIINAGTRELEATVDPIRVRQTIEVRDGDASIIIEPSDTVSYTYHIDYPNTAIGTASESWAGDRDEYINQVAPARTFSLEHEANQMHAAGLFTHLTPRDMLVIGEDGPIENVFRFENECARHKLLDLIGDLALVGAPLIAEVSATRSGHALAHDAARAILRDAGT
jgi:UDP-3-O-acyl N-acetylglucosamine deacetylase